MMVLHYTVYKGVLTFWILIEDVFLNNRVLYKGVVKYHTFRFP